MQSQAKYLFLISFILISAVFSQAEETSNENSSTFVSATVTSDYVSRGITQNNNLVSLQGLIEDSSFSPNLILGLWGSSAYGFGPEAELDAYFKYTLPISDNFKLAYSLLYYYYTKTHDFNTVDSQFYIETSIINFMFSYRQNFFGAGTNNLYYEIYKRLPIKKNVSFFASFGYAVFAQNERAGMNNHINYRLAFYRTLERMDNIELGAFFTNTNRKLLFADEPSVFAKDQALGVSLSVVF